MPSSSPTIVVANATASTSIFLEWVPPKPSTHNGIIRSYSVLLVEEDTGVLLTYEARGTDLVVMSLHPYYVYQCRVQAFTVGKGPHSDPVYVTTSEDGNLEFNSSYIYLDRC